MAAYDLVLLCPCFSMAPVFRRSQVWWRASFDVKRRLDPVGETLNQSQPGRAASKFTTKEACHGQPTEVNILTTRTEAAGSCEVEAARGNPGIIRGPSERGGNRCGQPRTLCGSATASGCGTSSVSPHSGEVAILSLNSLISWFTASCWSPGV